MNYYLITVSNEKGKFKRIFKKSKRDEFDVKYDIELQGEFNVEDIEVLTEQQFNDAKKSKTIEEKLYD